MLPDDLKKVFHYQIHELTDKRWEYDSTQLIQVLEKVVRVAKPKRYITGTLLTRRSTWVALVVLGLLLAVGSIQFLKVPGYSQRSDSGISSTGVVIPPPEPSQSGISMLKQYPPIEAIHILVVFTNFNYLVYSGSKVTGQYLDRHAKLVPFLDYLARDRQSTLL
jgi:hypothetical protein